MKVVNDLISFLIAYLTPKNISIVEENNILGIYDDNTLITKNDNFIQALEINGVSYISLSDENIGSLTKDRKNALNSINNDVNIKILIKRRKKIFNKEYSIDNHFAKKLINQWEKNEEIYENSYILIVETKNLSTIGYLEKTKQQLTTSINEVNHSNVNITYITKINILNNVVNRIMNSLSSFGVKKLHAKKILNIYAEYYNGFYIDVNVKNGLLGDSYIASNVTFKKDYFIQRFNDKLKYCRFISIKAYDCEEISSIFLSNLLYLEKEINVNFYIEKLTKQQALSKINEKIKFSSELVKPVLNNMKELIKTDRNSLQYFTFNVLILEDSKEKLDESSRDISVIFTNLGLINTYENINQLPTFLSFFPNKEFLNNRKRIQTTDAIATMLMLEKDTSGYSKNSWGDYPLTMFKNQNKSPFLFNLHTTDKENALGHNLIIGGTGRGKTTLMSWLIINCFKYDINILALDKANGLFSITNYLNGEYHDGNDESRPFTLNPFSLKNTKENKEFLINWLCIFTGLDRNDYEKSESISAIVKVIDNTFRTLSENDTKYNILEIKESILRITNDEFMKHKLNSASTNSIFNALEDSIQINNKLNVINMDFIDNNPKEAGLIVYYLLHKILMFAKNESKGFFAFIDEFRTYATNELIIERVNYIITQARKLNGVISLALQDLNQLNDIKNAQSIIDNMGSFIIFPTDNIQQFEKYNIQLSDYEAAFLTQSQPNCRKVLIKNQITKTSNIIDVDLSKINNNIAFLSSNADDVNLIKELKNLHNQDWRLHYLRIKNESS